MRKTLLNLAAAAAMVAVSAGAQADSLQNAPGGGAVIYTFSAVDWDTSGFSANSVISYADSKTWVVGDLAKVEANVTLIASSGDPAQVNDLSVLVSGPSALQVGGGYDFGAPPAQRYGWAGGTSTTAGDSLNETVNLSSPYLHFAGDGSDLYSIVVGNGQAGSGVASWSGSITLYGLQLAPVPEPATWAMFAAGAVGLVGWMGRRRKAVVTV